MSTNLNFDVERYKNSWWSGQERMYDHQKGELLDFWSQLFRLAGPLKSLPLESYDFYHDSVLRHSESGMIAVKTPHSSLTYSELHHHVSCQTPLWREMGLIPEKKIALVFPKGIDFTVALMTALRLGLNISIFPLNDPMLSRKCLQKKLLELDLDAIIAPPTFETALETFHPFELITTGEGDFSELSYAYSSGESVFGALSANEAFLTPLRDALIHLSLKEGTIWAKPLSSILQTEPFATLAALLSGATLYEVDDTELLSQPELLCDANIHLLGVSDRLLKLWEQLNGTPTKSLEFWYKSPFLGNLVSWKRFVESNQLEKTPYSDLLIQPERGGVTLASQPKPYDIPSLLHPPMGFPWKLLDLNDPSEESYEGIGYFNLNPELILGEIQGRYIISKACRPIRDGAFYCVEEVEGIVNQLKFALGCVIADDRNPNDLVGSRITLNVFISPRLRFQPHQTWEEEIRRAIYHELGEAHLPDRIQFYFFYPKFKEGSLHRSWALGQYHTGLLSKKEKNPLVQHLNDLRETLLSELIER